MFIFRQEGVCVVINKLIDKLQHFREFKEHKNRQTCWIILSIIDYVYKRVAPNYRVDCLLTIYVWNSNFIIKYIKRLLSLYLLHKRVARLPLVKNCNQHPCFQVVNFCHIQKSHDRTDHDSKTCSPLRSI